MGITASKSYDEIFGNIINITNGLIELSVTVDFGPRIIHFSLKGKQNMLFQDTKKRTIINEVIPEFGLDAIHKVYGGHRFWISPEIIERTYYPDDFPVEVEIQKSEDTIEKVIFTAPPEKATNIQKQIAVQLHENETTATIHHQIQNLGLWDATFAPWVITVFDKGGKTIIPLTKRETNYLPNRLIAIWPYTDIRDNRIYWGSEFVTITHDDKITRPLKIGTNNEDGWAAYFNYDQLFIKEYTHKIDAIYPDFGGASYQTYINNEIVEMESLGELVTLGYKETTNHSEKWRIYENNTTPSNDEDEIKRILKPYLN